MSTVLRLFAVATLALASTACGSTAGENDTDEGAVEAAQTRCGPPRGTPGMQAQTRCMEPQQLAEAKTIISILPGETGGFTYQLEAVTSNDKIAFLFPDKPYQTRAHAEEGVAALLRAAMNPAAFHIESADREHDSVLIKARNGQPLAISTVFKKRDRKAVVEAIQQALQTSDISLLTENNRARWTYDSSKKTFGLVAGNGRPMLESVPIAVAEGAVDNAIFLLHELVSADYATAQRASASEVCWQIGVVDANGKDVDAMVSKSVGMQPKGGGGLVLVVKQDGKLLATGKTEFADCSAAIEGAKTLTKLLNTMPRG